MLQVLHDDEVVVGLDGVADDAVQALEGSSIGLKVVGDRFLTVPACSTQAAGSGDHLPGLRPAEWTVQLHGAACVLCSCMHGQHRQAPSGA